MGQIVILRSVLAAHFEAIQQANNWQAITSVATGEVAFQGSFQAIQYLLEKSGVSEVLTSALFYPSVELVQGQDYMAMTLTRWMMTSYLSITPTR